MRVNKLILFILTFMVTFNCNAADLVLEPQAMLYYRITFGGDNTKQMQPTFGFRVDSTLHEKDKPVNYRQLFQRQAVLDFKMNRNGAESLTIAGVDYLKQYRLMRAAEEESAAAADSAEETTAAPAAEESAPAAEEATAEETTAEEATAEEATTEEATTEEATAEETTTEETTAEETTAEETTTEETTAEETTAEETTAEETTAEEATAEEATAEEVLAEEEEPGFFENMPEIFEENQRPGLVIGAAIGLVILAGSLFHD